MKRTLRIVVVLIILCGLGWMTKQTKADAMTIKFGKCYDVMDFEQIYDGEVYIKLSQKTTLRFAAEGAVYSGNEEFDLSLETEEPGEEDVYVNASFTCNLNGRRVEYYITLPPGKYVITAGDDFFNTDCTLTVYKEKLLTASKYMGHFAQKKKSSPKMKTYSKRLLKGESCKLKVQNAQGSNITWSSSNKKICTVSNYGKVTAKKAGVCKIYAKVKNKKIHTTIVVPTKLDLQYKRWRHTYNDSVFVHGSVNSSEIDDRITKYYYGDYAYAIQKVGSAFFNGGKADVIYYTVYAPNGRGGKYSAYYKHDAACLYIYQKSRPGGNDYRRLFLL